MQACLNITYQNAYDKSLLRSNQNKLSGSRRKRGSDNDRIGLAMAVPVVHGSWCTCWRSSKLSFFISETFVAKKFTSLVQVTHEYLHQVFEQLLSNLSNEVVFCCYK